MHSSRCFTGPNQGIPTLFAPRPGVQRSSSQVLWNYGGLSRSDALIVMVMPNGVGAGGPTVEVQLLDAGQEIVRIAVGGVPYARIIPERDVELVRIVNPLLGTIVVWTESIAGYKNDDGGPGGDPTGAGQ